MKHGEFPWAWRSEILKIPMFTLDMVARFKQSHKDLKDFTEVFHHVFIQSEGFKWIFVQVYGYYVYFFYTCNIHVEMLSILSYKV
jgi:hypothetical protein